MLVILRYQDELRKPDSYFDSIDTKVDDSAVKLAVDLIEQEFGEVRACSLAFTGSDKLPAHFSAVERPPHFEPRLQRGTNRRKNAEAGFQLAPLREGAGASPIASPKKKSPAPVTAFGVAALKRL